METEYEWTGTALYGDTLSLETSVDSVDLGLHENGFGGREAIACMTPEQALDFAQALIAGARKVLAGKGGPNGD